MGFNVKDISHTSTGDVSGYLSGSSTVLSPTATYAASTFSGSRGQAAYTVGDVVTALKNIGVLAVE